MKETLNFLAEYWEEITAVILGAIGLLGLVSKPVQGILKLLLSFFGRIIKKKSDKANKNILPLLLFAYSFASAQNNTHAKGAFFYNADSLSVQTTLTGLKLAYDSVGAIYYNEQSSPAKWRIWYQGEEDTTARWHDLIKPTANDLYFKNGLTKQVDSSTVKLGGNIIDNTTLNVQTGKTLTITQTGTGITSIKNVRSLGGEIVDSTLVSKGYNDAHYIRGYLPTINRLPYVNSVNTVTSSSALIWNNTNSALTVDDIRLHASGVESVFLGAGAGNFTTTGGNIGIGSDALDDVTSGSLNIALGSNALRNSVTTNAGNIAIGYQALLTSVGQIIGDYNIGIGYSPRGNPNSMTGSKNILFGYLSNNQTLTTGSDNILIGSYSGLGLTSGNNNVIIGNTIYAQSATGSGQLSIQNAIYGTSNSATGTINSSGNIGIYQKSPTYNLHLTANANNASAFLYESDNGSLYIKGVEAGGVTETTIKNALSGGGIYTNDSTLISKKFADQHYIRNATPIIITTGTYTPTLTNVTNVAASVADVWQYTRTGDNVSASGCIQIDITTALISTELGLSLPIASNFTSISQAGGTISATQSEQTSNCRVFGSISGDRAELIWSGQVIVTNQVYCGMFLYSIH